MEIDTKIAKLAWECNKLNIEFADVCSKRVKNVIFTDTGEPFVIDENVVGEYERIKHELSDKIDELMALKESKDEAT